jgi:cytoskeletal protein RodZ
MDQTGSLGHFLKREREKKNISLRDVSRNTRVREHLLEAIEADRYDLLPSPTFVKGFLQSYAKYVGLDPNEVVLRFQNVMKGPQKEEPSPPPKEETTQKTKPFWIIGGAVLGGILLILLLIYLTSQGPSTPSVPPTSPESEVKEGSAPAPSSNPPSPAQDQEGKPLSLQLKAAERTWIRFQIDDQAEKEAMLQPGETLNFRDAKRIYLLVGNAGGLDLEVNDKKLERFGKSREVVTLTFTPEGVEVKRKEKPGAPSE